MKLIILSSLLILSACRKDNLLVPVPPCEPHAEECNGLDDDCNGVVDDKTDQICDSICGEGKRICSKGVLLACNAKQPVPETCNGKDDDCNGKIDDGLEIKPCYPRSNIELTNGVCRFGVERCLQGKFQCSGWVGPSSEECNGLDDDCDGEVDEGRGAPLDIVFAIDYSASMGGVLGNLIVATSSWASKYSNRPDLKFSIVGIPSDVSDMVPTVMLNLGSSTDFVSELNKHPYTSGGGQEPSLDVIHMIAIPSNPLNINWTPGSRHELIVYSDEVPQSYMDPVVTQTSAKNDALLNDLKVFIFTSDLAWYTWNPKPFYQGSILEIELDKVIAEGSCK